MVRTGKTAKADISATVIAQSCVALRTQISGIHIVRVFITLKYCCLHDKRTLAYVCAALASSIHALGPGLRRDSHDIISFFRVVNSDKPVILFNFALPHFLFIATFIKYVNIRWRLFRLHYVKKTVRQHTLRFCFSSI